MGAVDVADLAREDLPRTAFPAPRDEAFRFYLAPEVHRGVHAHAKADPSVEICGVMVGRWGRDDYGPFAVASDFIRSTSAASKFAEVTFTHESWAEINREMDTKYADKRIIGWYHSHPDFGIFLSERDSFIHEHFFSGAGQVAYVVDPVRDLEGVFSWQAGKPTPMSHFWVGRQIHTIAGATRSDGQESSRRMPSSSPSATSDAVSPASMAPLPSSLGTSTTLLAWICLFLLGYGCAGWRSQAEMQLLVDRAVARHGVNAMDLDLETDIAKVRDALRATASELIALPKAAEKISPEEAAKSDKRRQMLADNLLLTDLRLEGMQRKYALSPDERAAYTRRVVAELLAAQAAANEPSQNKPSPKPAAPTDNSPKARTPQASNAPAHNKAPANGENSQSPAATTGEPPGQSQLAPAETPPEDKEIK